MAPPNAAAICSATSIRSVFLVGMLDLLFFDPVWEPWCAAPAVMYDSSRSRGEPSDLLDSSDPPAVHPLQGGLRRDDLPSARVQPHAHCPGGVHEHGLVGHRRV